MGHSIWAFTGIVMVMIMIPGPDTALVIRNSLAGGRIAGLATSLGVVAGQVIWELATAAGLTALLLASERVFHAVKLAGAAYLVFLGLQALWSAARSRDAKEPRPAGRSAATASRAFQQGAFSNLGNPKMAVLFASIFPQFVPKGAATFASVMMLGTIFSALTLAWLALYSLAVERASGFFRRSRVRRGMEGVTGLALVGLGTRLALEKD